MVLNLFSLELVALILAADYIKSDWQDNAKAKAADTELFWYIKKSRLPFTYMVLTRMSRKISVIRNYRCIRSWQIHF